VYSNHSNLSFGKTLFGQIFVRSSARTTQEICNLFAAASILHSNTTARKYLMDGTLAPIKTPNVVPHDIGCPGDLHRFLKQTQQLAARKCVREV